MDKIIVYINDADFALPHLQPMRLSSNPTQWILVACAPRLSHHASKWVNPQARENWCQQWAHGVFNRLIPALQARGDSVHTLLAHGDLPALTQALQAQHGPARVLDARCPRFGQDLPNVTNGQNNSPSPWQIPLAVASLGAVLALAAE
jgi:hypothetical protein